MPRPAKRVKSAPNQDTRTLNKATKRVVSPKNATVVKNQLNNNATGFQVLRDKGLEQKSSLGAIQNLQFEGFLPVRLKKDSPKAFFSTITSPALQHSTFKDLRSSTRYYVHAAIACKQIGGPSEIEQGRAVVSVATKQFQSDLRYEDREKSLFSSNDTAIAHPTKRLQVDPTATSLNERNAINIRHQHLKANACPEERKVAACWRKRLPSETAPPISDGESVAAYFNRLLADDGSHAGTSAQDSVADLSQATERLVESTKQRIDAYKVQLDREESRLNAMLAEIEGLKV